MAWPKIVWSLGACLLIWLILQPRGALCASGSDISKGLSLLEALTTTLSHHPQIHLQQQAVEIDRGKLQQASGEFDLGLNTSIGLTHDETPLDDGSADALGSSSQTTNQDQYTIGMQKRLRNGMLFNPSVSVTSVGTDPPEADAFATGRVDFLLTVPLGSGRGRLAAAANEMAAAQDLESGLLALQHTLSEKLLDTIVAYWEYLAAQQKLAELTAAQARADQMLAAVQDLVAADEQPAGDLRQLEASVADKTAARLSGELVLFAARQNMGLSMGIAYDQFALLPSPCEPFPVSAQAPPVGLDQLRNGLQQGALHLRADYLSLEADQKAGEILAQAARINLKPKWDLNVNIGYVGMSQTSALDRYAGSLSRNIPGASAGLVLQYSFPVANNTAKGILWQQRAALRQVRISAAELRRNIYANIGIALEAVVKRNLELSNARKAVQAYQMAVANEQEKFRLGLSSLLDVITIDERLTSALLYLADTGLNFAAAIARLRFESGTLVQMENGRAFVDQTCLTHFALSSCEGR